MLCNSLYNAHSMGIGGGFFMTIYQAHTKKTVSLTAWMEAAHYAHPKMFGKNKNFESKGSKLTNKEVIGISFFQPLESYEGSFAVLT